MSSATLFTQGAAIEWRVPAFAGSVAALILCLAVLPHLSPKSSVEASSKASLGQKNITFVPATAPTTQKNNDFVTQALQKQEQKDFATAEALLNQAAERLQDDNVSVLERIRFFDALSALRGAQRRLPDAVVALEQSIVLAGQQYGEESREVAYRYERMSEIYVQMQQPNAALLSREKTLRIALKDPAVSRASLAVNFNNLGEKFRQQGDYVRANDAYNIAMHMITEQNGAQSYEMIFPLNNAGLSALSQLQFDKASTFFKQAQALATKYKNDAAVQKIATNLQVLENARQYGLPKHLKVDPPEAEYSQ